MSTGSRLRQVGWLAALAICLACFVALTFRVNTVKSEVRLAERRIVQLEREKLLLETEFQTRANQQQLANWNTVEFGFKAPRADQYLENERQLASLGLPSRVGAPSPIRVARAAKPGEEGSIPEMVSPLTGKRIAPHEAPEQRPETGNASTSGSAASEFARAFGEATPIVARVAEVVE